MIRVTNCGHDSRHPLPCRFEYRQGLPNYLILLAKQEAWYYADGERTTLKPNTLICFSPGTYIHYGCDAPGYNDDWIHFSADAAEQELLAKLNPYLDHLLYPQNFHRLSEYVRQMTNIFHAASPYLTPMVDAFMHIFLYALLEETENLRDAVSPQYYRTFCELRTQIYNSPATTPPIWELANSLCLSLSYFQHLYKKFFHCSCGHDIILARLELAKYHLQNSAVSIRELSAFCGYNNELHFMRQFKKFVGKTPTEYRESLYAADLRNSGTV